MNEPVQHTPTVGPSPWSYTAGASPEALFMAATTNIIDVTVNDVSIIPSATSAGVNFYLPLAPGDVVVITYTGTLTVTRMNR